MQTILNTDDIVVGSKVFFIERRVPHTGYVKEIFNRGDQRLFLVDDVSFVDDFYDADHFEVLEDAIYKTDQIFLTKYPAVDEKMYVAQIMHSCGKDNILLRTDYPEFFRLYKNKTLFSNDVSKYHPKNGNYILFNNNTYLYLKDDEHAYRVYVIKLEKGLFVEVIGRLSGKSVIPDKIIIPEWLDPIRKHMNSSIVEDKTREYFKERYPENTIEVVTDLDMNEYNITSVYKLNEMVRERYFGNDVEKHPSKLFRTRNGVTRLNTKYLDKVL